MSETETQSFFASKRPFFVFCLKMCRRLLSSFLYVLLVAVLLGTTFGPPLAEKLHEGEPLVVDVSYVCEDFVPASVPESFYELSAKNINGETVSMADFKGKVVLVVNTASYWSVCETPDPLPGLLVARFIPRLSSLV